MCVFAGYGVLIAGCPDCSVSDFGDFVCICSYEGDVFLLKYENINMNENRKETIRFQSQMMHYGLYLCGPDAGFLADIPWHWHDEFEFGYISRGSMLYKTDRHEYMLHEGDGIFINSGVLHYLHPLEPFAKTGLRSQFFDRTFLAGSSGSIFDIKYVAPVQEQKLLDAVPLYRSDAKSRAFLEKMLECEKIGMEQKPFFELRLRSLFSELWETIYSWAMEKEETEGGYNPTEDERIKKMLTYMQEHYNEKLTVAQLGREVHVSERECYRLFRNILGITPGEFIISLRLQKAQELLWSSDKSILDIALETGFGTSSYFCKVFREHHHITPNQYRKMKL